MKVFGPKLLSYEPREILFLDECLSSPDNRPFEPVFDPLDDYLD